MRTESKTYTDIFEVCDAITKILDEYDVPFEDIPQSLFAACVAYFTTDPLEDYLDNGIAFHSEWKDRGWLRPSDEIIEGVKFFN